VSSSNFNNIFKLFLFLSKSFSQSSEFWKKSFVCFHDSGDVHHWGESIIWRLRTVYIVIRVDSFWTKSLSHDFSTSVANNFVSVHVWLGTGTSLPDYKWEVIGQFAFNYFIRSLNDSVCNFRVKTKLDVWFSSCFLQDSERFDDWPWHSFSFSSNLEVLKWSLSLSAPVFVGWHLDGTKGVSFLSKLSREWATSNKNIRASR